MKRTVFGLVLLLEGLSVMPAHAQDPQGMRRPKLVVTDTLDNVTTLQPTAGLNDGTDDGSATRGKDVSSWAGCGSSITNQGTANACSVDSSTCNSCSGYGFVRFSLASMPTSNIASAQIQLYTGVLHWSCGWPWAEDPVFGLRKVTSDWNEMTLDWNLQPTFDPTAIASYTFSGVAGLSNVAAYRWVSYDITDLYKGWASGTVPNYGVRISHDNPFCMNCDAAFFYSSDDGLTKVTYTGPITGNYGDPATVSAQLVNVADGSVVVGRTLSFTVGTQSCTANTDATGNASCGLTPSGTGTQTITVSFAGDLQYQASATTAQFQITGVVTNTPTNTPTSTPTSTPTNVPSSTRTNTPSLVAVVPTLNESGMLIFGLLIAAAGVLLLIRRR